MKRLDMEKTDLIERYADGLLNGSEIAFVQKLLKEDPDYADYHSFYTKLKKTPVQNVPAPLGLKQKVMTKIQTPQPVKTFIQYAYLAACLAGIIFLDISIGNTLKAADKAQTDSFMNAE